MTGPARRVGILGENSRDLHPGSLKNPPQKERPLDAHHISQLNLYQDGADEYRSVRGFSLADALHVASGGYATDAHVVLFTVVP